MTAVVFCQLDCFVDGNFGRNCVVELQFIDTNAQNITVDQRHLVNGPVFSIFFDLYVDICDLINNSIDRVADVFFIFVNVGTKLLYPMFNHGRQNTSRLSAKVPLVENLHDDGTSEMSTRHRSILGEATGSFGAACRSFFYINSSLAFVGATLRTGTMWKDFGSTGCACHNCFWRQREMRGAVSF